MKYLKAFWKTFGISKEMFLVFLSSIAIIVAFVVVCFIVPYHVLDTFFKLFTWACGGVAIILAISMIYDWVKYKIRQFKSYL